MKKLLSALAFTLVLNSNAQFQPAQRTCGTPELPAQYESWVQNIKPLPGKYGAGSTQSIFYIPVVVHIIHNNESVNSVGATSGNNLNAAQIIDQINILNKDYNGLNADTNLIPAIFKPLLGKFQVNFCLAVVNPTGGVMAEPGIDRINRIAKGWTATPFSQAYCNSTIKPNSIWDPNKYMNIWVAPLSGGLLGYATFPNPAASGIQGLTGTFGTATTDGVVILSTAFGSIGTAQTGQYNKGRTVTHEVGHWIGLRHIWGDASCGTDYCNDTPPAQNSNYNCPTFPYKLGTCSGNTTGEMTMNYMDYTNDACMYMFTADQKNRSQLILTNSPLRAALITSTVCNLPTVANDVGITFVSKPTYSQSISCLNTIDPEVNITNYGNINLTSAVFSFNVDGVNTQTLSWTGSLAPNSSTTVTLPQIGNLGFGNHYFSVSVSSPNGGSDNNTGNNSNLQNFSIVNNFAFNAPSGTVCQGGNVVLTASGATSYSWDTGVTTASVSLSPVLTSTYVVTGYYGLCSVPKTITVTVQASPVVSLNKTNVCENTPALIVASGANSYTWSSGETSPGITVTLSSSSNYTITAMAGAGCTTTQTFNIVVDPLPVAVISTTHASCASCTDAVISASGSGGTAPYVYSWMSLNMSSQTLSNIGVGCYEVTITDAKGCSVLDTACVTFNTGIFSQSAINALIKISPNPGQGIFKLEFNTVGTKKIEVIDALGKVIQRAETTDEFTAINLSAYANGIYYVHIITGNNSVVAKLIKQ